MVLMLCAIYTERTKIKVLTKETDEQMVLLPIS